MITIGAFNILIPLSSDNVLHLKCDVDYDMTILYGYANVEGKPNITFRHGKETYIFKTNPETECVEKLEEMMQNNVFGEPVCKFPMTLKGLEIWNPERPKRRTKLQGSELRILKDEMNRKREIHYTDPKKLFADLVKYCSGYEPPEI